MVTNAHFLRKLTLLLQIPDITNGFDRLKMFFITKIHCTWKHILIFVNTFKNICQIVEFKTIPYVLIKIEQPHSRKFLRIILILGDFFLSSTTRNFFNIKSSHNYYLVKWYVDYYVENLLYSIFCTDLRQYRIYINNASCKL